MSQAPIPLDTVFPRPLAVVGRSRANNRPADVDARLAATVSWEEWLVKLSRAAAASGLVALSLVEQAARVRTRSAVIISNCSGESILPDSVRLMDELLDAAAICSCVPDTEPEQFRHLGILEAMVGAAGIPNDGWPNLAGTSNARQRRDSPTTIGQPILRPATSTRRSLLGGKCQFAGSSPSEAGATDEVVIVND
jgi:hypothetical protein